VKENGKGSFRGKKLGEGEGERERTYRFIATFSILSFRFRLLRGGGRGAMGRGIKHVSMYEYPRRGEKASVPPTNSIRRREQRRAIHAPKIYPF
jgi:hypothetical protein